MYAVIMLIVLVIVIGGVVLDKLTDGGKKEIKSVFITKEKNKNITEKEIQEIKIPKKIKIIALIPMFFLIFYIFFVEVIPAGFVGVVYSPWGGIKNETLAQGWKIVNPLYKVTKYTIAKEQGVMENVILGTNGGNTIRANIEFSYNFDPENITELFKMYRGKEGKRLLEEVMQPKIVPWTEEVTTRYSVTDIYSSDKRMEINKAIKDHLKEKFKSIYVVIDTVNISNVSTDERTYQMIQEIINAEQRKKLENIKKEEAQIIAERKLIEANNEKDIMIKKAEAEGESIEKIAIAKRKAMEEEAKGNQSLAQSLTPAILKNKELEKWNGVKPQVEGLLGDVSPVIDMRKK